MASLREYQHIVSMTFTSQQEAYEFYNDHAKKKGFSIRKSIFKKDPNDNTIIFRRFCCSRSGFREKKYLDKPDRKRPASALSRCGCPVELCVKFHPKTGRWWVHNYIDVHNHSFAASDTTPFFRSHGSINEAQKFEIISFQDSGVHNFQILDYTERRSGIYEYCGFQSKNMYNFSTEHEQSAMLADDIDSIIKYFKERKKMDSNFYFNYEAIDGHLMSLF
jgi:FAR1 DNA-binding domain